MKQQKKIVAWLAALTLIGLALFVIVPLLGPHLHAGDPADFTIIPQQPKGTFGSITQLIQRLFTVGITVGGIIFLILFMVGSIIYLSSSGNEDGTKKGRTMMIDAIIGLILVLASWTLARFLGSQLGAPGFNGPAASVSTEPTSTPSAPSPSPSKRTAVGFVAVPTTEV